MRFSLCPLCACRRGRMGVVFAKNVWVAGKLPKAPVKWGHVEVLEDLDS